MKKTGILFVCTGNICRSPTAEGVFRHLVREAGLEDRFHIDSAGTHGYHIGEPPDTRAVVAAAAHGVSIGDLRARQIAVDDFDLFDLILAMDGGHLRHLARMARAGEGGETSLFLGYPDGDGADVPDPYYGGQRDFEQMFALIHDGAGRLFNHLCRDA